MALAKVKKIQLIATRKKKNRILEILQNCGVVEIGHSETKPEKETDKRKISQDATKELQKVELDHANISYVIKFLENQQEKKPLIPPRIILDQKEIEEKIKASKYLEIIEECLKLEDSIVKAKNKVNGMENEIRVLSPWKKLEIPMEKIGAEDHQSTTKHTKIILGTLKNTSMTQAENELINFSSLLSIRTVEKDRIDTGFYIIYIAEQNAAIRQILTKHKFIEAEFPHETGLVENYLKTLKESIGENNEIVKKSYSELKKYLKNLEELKVVHDYLSWQKEKLEQDKKLANTEYSFEIKGWIPEHTLKDLTEQLEKETREFMIEEIQPGVGGHKDENGNTETPPVILKSNRVFEPFESITRVYGLPLYNELDPTPFHSLFFILFFALCLSDAGYGIIMFSSMALILKFIKLPKETVKLVKTLMIAGGVTFIVGALFGGWFGIEAKNMPDFLTYTTANGEIQFIFQKFNSLIDPLTILILALGLGFVQILFGTFIKLAHGIKYGDKKLALLETAPWAFMLTGIGFFISAAGGILPAGLIVVGKWWMILGAVGLVLTQGHDKKGIIMKALSGILSLYGLIGYLSDVLSYSRLLALGIATSIIALAFNTIGGLLMDIPWVGWIFAIAFLIVGHTFNLLINALGAFIHSGRLQFVEFFGKFLEGGGRAFQPFSKKSKYIYIKDDGTVPNTRQNRNLDRIVPAST